MVAWVVRWLRWGCWLLTPAKKMRGLAEAFCLGCVAVLWGLCVGCVVVAWGSCGACAAVAWGLLAANHRKTNAAVSRIVLRGLCVGVLWGFCGGFCGGCVGVLWVLAESFSVCCVRFCGGLRGGCVVVAWVARGLRGVAGC